MKRYIISIILILILFEASAQREVPESFCLSQDEFALFERINQYRTEQTLPLIGLSKSLSYVARMHVEDLSNNSPDTSICNLHSWSDQGNWSSCCYQGYVPNPECMHHKPRELTNCTARGYELAFWDVKEAIPDSAMLVWEYTYEANNMLLNKGRWAEKTWRAMGVGIYGNYAVIWFGQRTDLEEIPEICGDKKPLVLTDIVTKSAIKSSKNNDDIPVIRKSTGYYYVIFGSYDNEKDAVRMAKRYIRKGFTNTKVIVSKDKFRVTLSDHIDLETAKAYKAGLDDKYLESWIIRY